MLTPRRASVLTILALAACGGFSGSYSGTFTLTLSGVDVVASAEASVQDDQDNVHIFATGATSVDCTLQGMTTTGSTTTFDCIRHQCFGSVGAGTLQIDNAKAVLEGEQVAITFAGTESSGSAFTATFVGTLVPGTK